MFESAELGNKIDKEIFQKEEPEMRQSLLTAQYEVLKASKFPIIIVVGGIDGAGKGETANLLNEWMDPRYIRSHAFGERFLQKDRSGFFFILGIQSLF